MLLEVKTIILFEGKATGRDKQELLVMFPTIDAGYTDVISS
jgi:hypothetical protein